MGRGWTGVRQPPGCAVIQRACMYLPRLSGRVQRCCSPHASAELMDGKGVAASAGLKVVEEMKARDVKICILQDGAPAELEGKVEVSHRFSSA